MHCRNWRVSAFGHGWVQRQRLRNDANLGIAALGKLCGLGDVLTVDQPRLQLIPDTGAA
jgi:hypothetical protein